jgi:hypothetical protein
MRKLPGSVMVVFPFIG